MFRLEPPEMALRQIAERRSGVRRAGSPEVSGQPVLGTADPHEVLSAVEAHGDLFEAPPASGQDLVSTDED